MGQGPVGLVLGTATLYCIISYPGPKKRGHLVNTRGRPQEDVASMILFLEIVI